VYKTKDGKWSAVTREIETRYKAGQPVLVGTISVEVSELLSQQLTKRGIKHTVLNAKPEHAEREGETIAEAGAPGAVTIATNMAGRGVDIKLGGNPEHLARLEVAKLGLQAGEPDYDEHFQRVLPSIDQQVEGLRRQVLEAGGLFILGTERHESRRIDNQLRGRSGRQGDPGESRFFLSAQDDLVRLFAGERIYKILDRLGTTDDEGNEEPIEAGMLSKQIEKAQKKVEEQHFLMRKHTLEYDDVLNQQREVIYSYRDEILEGRDMSDAAREEVVNLIERLVEEYTAGDFVEDWDVPGLLRRIEEVFTPSPALSAIDPGRVDRDDLTTRLQDEALAQYERREQELGSELMRALERFLLLQIIDQRWREHLYDMDYLREGIHLRGFAQIEPLVAYKNEAFELFRDLMNSIWGDFARMIFHVQVTVEGQEPMGPPPIPTHRPGAGSSSSTGGNRNVTYSGGGAAQPSALALAAAGAVEAAAQGYPAQSEMPPPVEQRRVDESQQLGRNDPCWCGSGKKFKKCHGA
jgi:preprotein translocase subunit SecA